MAWQQLAVYSRRPEFAEELMLAHGASSVVLQDAADDPVLEPGPGETPLWARTCATGLFPDTQDLAAVMAALRAALPEGVDLRMERAQLEDQEWVRVWLDNWEPLRFGAHLWVSPAEKQQHIQAPGAVIVTLDPGLAFGTGTHASTALCLEWLADATLHDRRVLDYGCGSGILAIAALKLGARAALGVDLDPQALQATRANAATNGVGQRLEACLPAAFTPAPYDVVLANILAQPLIGLAPLLARCVVPGGDLVLAGLLQRQADEVRAAYAPYFTFGPGAVRDGWQRLDARRHKE